MVTDQGNIDELTGLADLVRFHARLGADMAAGAHRADADPLALVYFNVQNFKAYNEHYGFPAGNELLVLVADAIREAYPGCTAARFSADQFMVAAPRSAVEDGVRQVRAAFRAHHKDSSIWLKAGFYVLQPGDSDAGVACDRAKLACDDIKGRRDVFYREYDEALQQKILLHRYVLDHFDEALENHWVKIYYQPIVRVATGEVCDEEALARWVDPMRGVIAPGDFIPVLEEARLIHRLDLYMVRRACENFARIAADGFEPIPVSVNLSRVDFELCDIVAEVESIVDEFGVSHGMLAVEVTESALTGNSEFLRGEIDRFRDHGFEVWIDDFGAGYSSLSTLKEYTFDLVKVDMAFLDRFAESSVPRIMLAHIISLVKELGLKTLVEGVETAEQLAYLKSVGCGRAQGFLLGGPTSLADTEDALVRHAYPHMEPQLKRPFYEDVGRVNLIRPDPVEMAEGVYVPSDVAAAIVRRRYGRYEYLNTSELFVRFLRDAGMGSVANCEHVMNEPGNARRDGFVGTVDRCVESGAWESYEVPAGGGFTVRMRPISSLAATGAAAVLVIVD